MRVLDGVKRADFDIPTETFSIEMKPGAETAPVLAAIQELGYRPEILEKAPEKRDVITQLSNPTSTALRDALARAKARDVFLIIDFGGPFCHLCRKFEETALKDERVVEMLADFEFVKIDTEADAEAVKDLDVHGVPDIWALDGHGEVLARNNGYLTPEAFAGFMKGLGK